MKQDDLIEFFQTLASGLIIAHLLTSERKEKTSTPPYDNHLAPPGSHPMYHDHSVAWHGDQLRVERLQDYGI